MPVLVVAAWEPELTHVRALLAGSVEAGEVVVVAIGVGLVEAAAGASWAVARHAPTHALFLGTCGRLYARDVPLETPSEVVVGVRAGLFDVAAHELRSSLPQAMSAEVPFDASLRDLAVRAGAKPVHIANTIGVTTDDALAATLALHADVEHLEAFAFGRACALHGVPCAPVLGVANSVGSCGREQWRARHVEASARAAEIGARVVTDLLRTTTTRQSPARA